MANQRPINRRPAAYARRRGRWKAFNKALHPVRWLDCNSTQGQPEPATCGTNPLYVSCEPLASPVELLVGDLDWDWSDTSEVRIDRIVGTMSWSYVSSSDSMSSPPLPLLLRFGILATEDTDRVYQTIDLFDPEALEEYSWMWLHQSVAYGNSFINGAAQDFFSFAGSLDTQLDIRTRRKLGKKDSIVLYAQTKLVAPAPAGFTVSSGLTWMLRAIIRS